MNDAISYIFSENLFMISGPVLNHIMMFLKRDWHWGESRDHLRFQHSLRPY